MVGIRKTIEGYAPIPVMKSILAVKYRDKRWRNVRPPLLEAGADDGVALATRLGLS